MICFFLDDLVWNHVLEPRFVGCFGDFFLQILLKLGGSWFWIYADLVQLPGTKNVGAPVSCRVKDTVDSATRNPAKLTTW